MRAWVYERYGSVDELQLREVSAPVPSKGEVLVEVVATSVNLSDWEALQGSPGYARFDGLRAPRTTVLGSDVAGRVVAVGDGVTRFRVGDEVYGDNIPRRGGFAEYVAMPERAIAHKPAGLTFAEASTIPQAGAIALQAVAHGRPGERLLINGAGGGSGSFMIQLAAAKGLHVTAVDNAGKLGFLQRLGAHEVIDYRRTDFTRTGPYDLTIDLVAHRSVFAYRRALARGGRCLMVGGTLRTMLRMLTIGPLLGALTGTRLGVLFVREGGRHFSPLGDLCASGEIDIHIDRTHPLADAPATLAFHGEGRACGKVVVIVRDPMFVPDGFTPPTSLVTERFRLEPLGPQHNEADHAAWTSSIEHIRATPGYPKGNWPPSGGMSLEANLGDLTRHAADFSAREGFTFTVLDPDSGDVIGCVYLYPSASDDFDVEVRTWVTADRADLDTPLADAVNSWLVSAWPWQRINRFGR